MKKQILVLTMLLLALIFSTSNTFGQNSEEDYIILPSGGTIFCPPAVTLNCATGTGLTPIPGQEYTYEISASSMSTVHWIVTDEANVMTAPGTLTTGIDPVGTGSYVLTNPDGFYNDPANTSASITLSWKSFNGTLNNVLLVAYVWDATTCTDNIEVYRIEPQYSFTLDLAGILDTGAEGATECVGNIQSAAYDAITGLTVTYGDNYVFYAVTAANWQTSWRPTISAVTEHGTVGTVEWAYPDDATTGGPWNASLDDVLATEYSNNNNGWINEACIIVRVQVVHGTTTENLTDETVTLSADGEMINPQTSAYDGAYLDLDEPASGSGACVNNITDTFDYIITPRPTITAVDPQPFETKVPTGD